MNQTPLKIATDCVEKRSQMKLIHETPHHKSFGFNGSHTIQFENNPRELTFEIAIYNSSHQNYPAVIHFLEKMGSTDELSVFREYKMDYNEVIEIFDKKSKIKEIWKFLDGKLTEENLLKDSRPSVSKKR